MIRRKIRALVALLMLLGVMVALPSAASATNGPNCASMVQSGQHCYGFERGRHAGLYGMDATITTSCLILNPGSTVVSGESPFVDDEMWFIDSGGTSWVEVGISLGEYSTPILFIQNWIDGVMHEFILKITPQSSQNYFAIYETSPSVWFVEAVPLNGPNKGIVYSHSVVNASVHTTSGNTEARWGTEQNGTLDGNTSTYTGMGVWYTGVSGHLPATQGVVAFSDYVNSPVVKHATFSGDLFSKMVAGEPCADAI